MNKRQHDHGRSRSAGLRSDLTDNPKKKIWAAAAIIILALAGFADLRTAFLAQLALPDSRRFPAFSRSQTDPGVLTALARREHLVNGHLEKALDLYKRALDHFVLYMPAWLGLAELFNDQGDRERAGQALQFAEDLAPDNGYLAWSRALLANELGNEDILTANLAWLVQHRKDKRQKVFFLADRVWDDPLVLLDKFGISCSPDLLRYYIRTNTMKKTRPVWGRLEAAGLGDRKIALHYINYLMGHHETGAAAEIWSRHFKKDAALLYNGHLQEPLTGSGFGWRVSRTKGVSRRNPVDQKGLQITFDGSSNPVFRLSQIVALPPGSYDFSGVMETKALTTDQRPFWTVRGYDCKAPAVQGEMTAPTGKTDFHIRFTVPDSCPAVRITLQRNRSYYFDNKISGILRIDNLTIQKSD